MSEFKEVWYVWDGKGRPMHAGDIEKVLHKDGFLAITIDFPEVNQHDPSLWQHTGRAPDIVSYTTGQKRRRVECPYHVLPEPPEHKGTCSVCKGTGKAWEYKQGVE